MEEKKVIVNVSDLANIHNILVQLHPTGDDIINVANCILNLRRIVETSSEPKEAEEI